MHNVSFVAPIADTRPRGQVHGAGGGGAALPGGQGRGRGPGRGQERQDLLLYTQVRFFYYVYTFLYELRRPDLLLCICFTLCSQNFLSYAYPWRAGKSRTFYCRYAESLTITN